MRNKLLLPLAFVLLCLVSVPLLTIVIAGRLASLSLNAVDFVFSFISGLAGLTFAKVLNVVADVLRKANASS